MNHHYEGNIKVDYEISPKGCYMQLITMPAGTVVMASYDVDKFLKRIVQSEVDADERSERRLQYLIRLERFWSNRCKEENIRGHFNIEHYNKVLLAKRIYKQWDTQIPTASKWSKFKFSLKKLLK